MQAKVLIAPRSLRSLAEQWAVYGLLGETAWVAAEQASAATRPEGWETVSTHVLGGESVDPPGVEPVGVDPVGIEPGLVEVPLLDHLSVADRFDSVLVLWVRTAADADEAAMAAAVSFLTTHLPPGTPRVLVDLIAPRTIDDAELPYAPSGWKQYLVATQDHPERGGVDAGWSIRATETLLHTAAALGGFLAGQREVVGDQMQQPQVAHVFSRHLVGGGEAHAQAQDFVDSKLGVLDASTVAPHRFTLPRESDPIVEASISWLRSARGACLAYTLPAPLRTHVEPSGETSAQWSASARPAPVGPALGTSSPEDSALDDSPRSASRLPWGGLLAGAARILGRDRLVAFTELEENGRASVAEIEKRITAAAEHTGSDRAPEKGIWEDLFRMASGSVDGGAMPMPTTGEAFPRRSSDVDKEIVLEPVHVVPDPAYSDHVYDEALRRGVPELGTAPPLPITRSALAAAEASLRAGSLAAPANRMGSDLPPSLLEYDGTLYEEQADALAGIDLTSEDSSQGEGATGPGLAPEPHSIVDRVYRDLLRDALLAARDARRWRTLATGRWPDRKDTHAAAGIRGPRAAAGSGVVIGAGMGITWALFHDSINAWLAGHGWTQIGETQGYLIAAVLGLALIVGGAFAAASRARMELRRLSEEVDLRLQLGDRATSAYQEHARLYHALRIYHYWWVILHELYRSPEPDEKPAAAHRPSTPRSLQIAEPAVHVNYYPTMLAQGTLTAGWRGDDLRELAAVSLSKYPDRPVVFGAARRALLGADSARTEVERALYEDLGTDESPLARVARDLATDAIRAEWRLRKVSAAQERLLAALTADVHEVSMIGPGGASAVQHVGSFLSEIIGSPDITPGQNQLPPEALRTPMWQVFMTMTGPALGRQVTRAIHPTDALGAATVHLALVELPAMVDEAAAVEEHARTERPTTLERPTIPEY